MALNLLRFIHLIILYKTFFHFPKRINMMDIDINKLKEKGLVPETIKLCRQIYHKGKGIKPSREYRYVHQLNKQSNKILNLIDKLTYDDKKSSSKIKTVNTFNGLYNSAINEDAQDLIPNIQIQIKDLSKNLNKLINNTNQIIERLEGVIEKLKSNNLDSPELVIDILFELYLIQEKNHLSNTNKFKEVIVKNYKSDFEEWVKPYLGVIGIKESSSKYIKIMENKEWKHSKIINKFLIPYILERNI